MIDVDDPKKVYNFMLDDPGHAACFRMSESGDDMTMRISYSSASPLDAIHPLMLSTH